MRAPKSEPSSSLICAHANMGCFSSQGAAGAQHFWFSAQHRLAADPVYQLSSLSSLIVKLPLWLAALNLSLNLTHLCAVCKSATWAWIAESWRQQCPSKWCSAQHSASEHCKHTQTIHIHNTKRKWNPLYREKIQSKEALMELFTPY